MAEVDKLVLEMLRAIRGDVATIHDVQLELGVRLAELGTAMAGLRRDNADDAEVTAHLAVRVDPLRDEMDRIKRRLEIAD